MAENDGKTTESGVATPDALAQVDALKNRVLQSGADIEEANRRANAATELAARAVSEVAAIRAESADTGRTTELESANREMDDLRSKYEEAFASGDGKVLGDIQTKMARLGGKIDRLETDRAAKPARTAADTGRVVARDPAAVDPFENFLSTRTAPTAAWLRMNRDHWSDPITKNKIEGADLAWGKTGKPKDSPEYFRFIEKEAGLSGEPVRAADDGHTVNDQNGKGGKTSGDTGTRDTAATLTPAGANDALPAGRRAPPQAGRGGRGTPVAAPPSRDGAPNLSGRGNSGEKRITPEMQAWAKMMYPPTKDNPEGGIDPELYYDEYVRLHDEGEINDRFGRG